MNLLVEIKRHRLKLLVFAAVVAAACWLVLRNGGVSKEEVMDFGRRLPALWFAAAFAVLPLAGFPITPFLVLSGLRFGFAGGIAITAAAMFLHNLAVYQLVHHRFREKFRRKLTARGYSIPTPAEGHQVWFTALYASVHGPPYAAKLYLLALTEIPLRIHLWVAAPVYILFGAIPVGAGSSAIAVNSWWLYGAIIAMVLMAILARWLHKRFSSEVDGKPEEG